MSRRVFLPTAVFLTWTLIVWVGRVRNALSDEALVDGGRTGPLLLSLSFVLPALVLAVVLLRARSRTSAGAGLRYGVLALGAWTVGVWVVRLVDIALFSDRDVSFVVVHVVLGTLSIGAAVFAARAMWSGRDTWPGLEPADPFTGTGVR